MGRGRWRIEVDRALRARFSILECGGGERSLQPPLSIIAWAGSKQSAVKPAHSKTQRVHGAGSWGDNTNHEKAQDVWQGGSRSPSAIFQSGNRDGTEANRRWPLGNQAAEFISCLLSAFNLSRRKRAEADRWPPFPFGKRPRDHFVALFDRFVAFFVIFIGMGLGGGNNCAFPIDRSNHQPPHPT